MDFSLLSQVVRGRSRDEVIKDLDAFYALRAADQEKVRETIDALFAQATMQQFVRKPDLISACVSRLTKDSLDGDLRDRLTERATEVIDACYQLNPRKGVINPHYIAPAPTSRELAASGNAR